ncbi:MAG: class B sortase [Bacilli bacterium]|nr:class B sortase [Bacilli bacterium]
MKKKKRNKLGLIILIIISSLLLSTLTISLFNIFLWNKDNKANENNLKDIEKNTEIKIVKDNDNTEFINKPLDENDDYWYYSTFDLIDVDLKKLKEKNNDTIGWLNVNNTNINYPFVKSSDNDYYLHHSFDKSYNNAGWVFLDYRNNKNLTDKNNIIYGHHRVNNTMFTSLLNTLNESWYTNKDNHIIRVSLENENSLWQIISVYKIPVESYYITTKFNNDNEFITFLDTISKRSIYNFNYNVNKEDIILTLSTCYDDNTRVVVHAKLIKIEKKNSD